MLKKAVILLMVCLRFARIQICGETMKTAILGGGLTSLTLGYLLKRKRVDFEILEKNNECGGLMRSLQEEGFTFDFGGSHVIFSKDKEVLNFMINLLGDNKIKNRRNTKILYDGHFVKYPFENGLSDLPKQDNFECLYYYIQNFIKKEKGGLKKPKNFKEFLYCTFGKGIAEKYLIPQNEKMWKYPLEKISLEWVGRVPNPPVRDIVKSSLGIKTEGYTHQLIFYYPKKGGIQALIRSLESEIKENISTSFNVKKIRREDKEWIISNGTKEKECDEIISTIPIFDLVDAMNAPKEIKNASKNLKYNSLITVMIALDVPKINDFSWLYIPDETILAHRVSFPSNYSNQVAPSGKSSVLAEITCNVGDEIWRMKDEDLTGTVTDDLHRLKIVNKRHVLFAKVKRIEYAYVIYDLDYHKNMKIVREFMRNTEIPLVGRFAEFEYLNMDACIQRAMDYVNNFATPK